MTRHGIDQSQQTIAQIVQFCECLESMEQIPRGSSTKQLRKTTKMRKSRDQLAETANVAAGKMAQMGRQKKNTEMNVEKETTLPTDVE